jgi:hypothetical protein
MGGGRGLNQILRIKVTFFRNFAEQILPLPQGHRDVPLEKHRDCTLERQLGRLGYLLRRLIPQGYPCGHDVLRDGVEATDWRLVAPKQPPHGGAHLHCTERTPSRCPAGSAVQVSQMAAGGRLGKWRLVAASVRGDLHRNLQMIRFERKSVKDTQPIPLPLNDNKTNILSRHPGNCLCAGPSQSALSTPPPKQRMRGRFAPAPLPLFMFTSFYPTWDGEKTFSLPLGKR